jgi:glyoxylase-like metal-dependent hydrolase (beta-lactamase superfamily II)
MNISQHINSIFNSNTYLIKDKSYDYCWLIDIGDTDYLIDNSLNINGIFLTHSHFDHIYGINKIIEKFPDCIIYTSKSGNKALYSDKLNLSKYHESPLIFNGNNVKIINENDKIEIFPNISLEVIETPGHSRGSVCFYCEEENTLWSGDTLFEGSIGRTDLEGGNYATLIKSITDKLLTLPENTKVYPGHGSYTTIADEKMYNPYL